jgi:hypothetical protein
VLEHSDLPEYGSGVDVTNISTVPSFTTKDGSEIRELLAHRNSAIRNQSLAEARLAPGQARRSTIIVSPKRFTTSRMGPVACASMAKFEM